MRPEILAPVGSPEALKAALAAGCDAVYFGLPHFGARAYAQNFDLEQAKEVIDQCHLVDVKVHVTMNTILFEDELEQAYQCAYQLYQYGVDALIVQDIGLMYLLCHRLPDLTIHASTQCSIRTPEEIERFKKLGVKRVVLARECSKEEVEICKKAGLEVEIFVHGAICISMSGRCFLSSFLYQRSGNRGMCAQPCRMPYTLYKDGKKVPYKDKYLLSPKDLSLIDYANELGVDSLKIEGRMKSAEYVYEAVSQVKKVLDGNKRTKEDEKLLKVAFNRGYTPGHYFQQKGLDLMNMTTSNHQGIPIGKVIQYKHPYASIQLFEDLEQNDGIRIGEQGFRLNYLYDEKGRLQNHIDKKQIAKVKCDPVKKGTIVLKTASYKLEQDVQEKMNQVRQIQKKLFVSCQGISKPLIAYVDGLKIISDALSQQALKRSTDEEILTKQLSKTKSEFVSFTYEFDLAENIYFSIPEMNAFRRKIVEELRKKQIQRTWKREEKLNEDIEIVHHDPQIHTTLPKLCANRNFNVVNSYAVAGLIEMGFEYVLISDECDQEHTKMLVEAFIERYQDASCIIKTIYHTQKLMTMQHCPVNTIEADGKREKCSLCHTHHYELVGADQTHLVCRGDSSCFMGLYSDEKTNEIAKKSLYDDMNLSQYFVEFFDEEKNQKKLLLEML